MSSFPFSLAAAWPARLVHVWVVGRHLVLDAFCMAILLCGVGRPGPSLDPLGCPPGRDSAARLIAARHKVFAALGAVCHCPAYAD